MKKSINFTITDIDDVQAVSKAFSHLFSTVLMNYEDNKEFDKTDQLVLGCYQYFKIIMIASGYEEENK
jgi:hypothetical protein